MTTPNWTLNSKIVMPCHCKPNSPSWVVKPLGYSCLPEFPHFPSRESALLHMETLRREYIKPEITAVKPSTAKKGK